MEFTIFFTKTNQSISYLIAEMFALRRLAEWVSFNIKQEQSQMCLHAMIQPNCIELVFENKNGF